jgi:hypothetical protein
MYIFYFSFLNDNFDLCWWNYWYFIIIILIALFFVFSLYVYFFFFCTCADFVIRLCAVKFAHK